MTAVDRHARAPAAAAAAISSVELGRADRVFARPTTSSVGTLTSRRAGRRSTRVDCIRSCARSRAVPGRIRHRERPLDEVGPIRARPVRADAARMSACRLRALSPRVEPVDPASATTSAARPWAPSRSSTRGTAARRAPEPGRRAPSRRSPRATGPPSTNSGGSSASSRSTWASIDCSSSIGVSASSTSAARPEVRRAVHPGQQDERQHVSP